MILPWTRSGDKMRMETITKDNAPFIWAALRSFSLNILRIISDNIPEAIDLCAAKPQIFLKIVT